MYFILPTHSKGGFMKKKVNLSFFILIIIVTLFLSGKKYDPTNLKWKFLGDLIYQGTVFCRLFPCYSLNEN